MSTHFHTNQHHSHIRTPCEAPLTLTTEPPRPLRFTDQLALWANLGISLFGPLTGALIATTAGSVGLAITAIVVGCVPRGDSAGILGRHRHGDRSTGHGLAPRAGRTARLGAADSAQHRAERGLGDDGDHRHFDGRRRRVGPVLALALRDLGRSRRHR